MSQAIPFTDNYNDLSNSNGYQFEFRCERCGNGYRSAFQPDKAMTGRGLLRSLGDMVGGPLRDIGNAADDFVLNRGTNSSAKDRALAKAVAEISPEFTQCKACGDWVCRDACWNEPVGQCVRCAPPLHDELAKLQAEARRVQVRDRLAAADLLQGTDIASDVVATCPSCGARATGGKFCAECGSSLSRTSTCDGCSAELPDGARFCPECGTRART
ncbi:hypothetical protein GCM10025864_12870 [Luteimicrobium album]|uniref:DZANK-type domain-containing protein n=1 Tax=Luteimicrobium album TaxID=1054550 RepID=A0ABQ6I0P9_9MICO|nr:zinc ribbon domain-containing protein [Luteimicrobium album]GMA23528.1 hypothetical protein GCM10025864_12870 [Luteimicrobium album]